MVKYNNKNALVQEKWERKKKERNQKTICSKKRFKGNTPHFFFYSEIISITFAFSVKE